MSEMFFLSGVIALPLLGALVATVWTQQARYIGILATFGMVVCAVGLLQHVQQHGALLLEIGGWQAGLGITLYADGLAVLLVLMSSLVMFASSVYALKYFSSVQQHTAFWPLWLLLATALSALLLAGDLFNIYVTLELLGISAAALAALGGKREGLISALRYLVVGLLGSMLYLGGIALLYAAYGTLNLQAVAAQVQPEPVAWVALLLLFSGLMLKMALFPLHFWLPPAHSNAPAPVSAALSALVVKAAFYLLLRFWLDLFPAILTPLLANALGVLGAMAVLWGSWSALRAERLKLLAAYSSVSQLGYLVMFLPLLTTLEGEARNLLLGGMVVFALTHAFAKAALFMSAGILLQHCGHDRIRELGGTAQRLPLTMFVIALSGVALVGLPPSGAFDTGQWWWVIVVGVGSLIATAYVFRLLGHAFGHLAAVKRPLVSGMKEIPALLLALLATVGLGMGAAGIWPLLGETSGVMP